LAAALGGAARVTTVDVAPEAIADAKENFRLNGLDPNHHRFETADIFKWELGETTDLMVIDPPSLARGKQAKSAAVRCYKQLHQRHAFCVTRDGLLATSSCTAQLSFQEWRAAVAQGLDPWGWSWLSESRAPPDHPVALGHPEGQYLKFSLLRRLAKRR
jgi:23S rRNA (cytosine1962-C5)-methyltransferase